VQKVISISDDTIKTLVQKYSGLKGKEMGELADTLIACKRYIANKYPHMKPLKTARDAGIV